MKPARFGAIMAQFGAIRRNSARGRAIRRYAGSSAHPTSLPQARPPGDRQGARPLLDPGGRGRRARLLAPEGVDGAAADGGLLAAAAPGGGVRAAVHASHTHSAIAPHSSPLAPPSTTGAAAEGEPDAVSARRPRPPRAAARASGPWRARPRSLAAARATSARRICGDDDAQRRELRRPPRPWRRPRCRAAILHHF